MLGETGAGRDDQYTSTLTKPSMVFEMVPKIAASDIGRMSANHFSVGRNAIAIPSIIGAVLTNTPSAATIPRFFRAPTRASPRTNGAHEGRTREPQRRDARHAPR